MRIIAFDPGGTTGWKSYDAVKQEFLGGQLAGQHHSELYKKIAYYAPDVVIYETFEYRNKSRAGLVLDSREYIGVIKLYHQTYDSVVLKAQSPAQAKGFVKDEHLKKAGLWEPGNPHENDACRHLVYYLVNGDHGFVEIKKYLLMTMYK